MATSTEKLEHALGLQDEFANVEPSFEVMPVPKRKTNVPAISNETIEQNKADDYDYARGTMTHLMAQGNEALMGILKLASEGPNPRVYEVVSTLIKTVSDVSKDLIELDDKMKVEDDQPLQKANTINNTQITVSHEEAIRMAKEINGK